MTRVLSDSNGNLVDQSEAVRQMGREDGLRFWWPGSEALKHWAEGFEERDMIEPYYKDEFCTIFNARCEDVLPRLEPVDLVLTSPPYNLGEGMEDKGGLRIGHGGSKWGAGTLHKGYYNYSDDLPYPEYCKWQREILQACWDRLTPTGAIYYNHKPRLVRGELRLPFFTELPLRQIVIWDRGGGFNYMAGAYCPHHEWVMVYAKPGFRLRDKAASGVGDVWRIQPERGTPHPAPFPLALARRAIKTTRAQTVLDPFMGGGTVLRAAKDLGMKSIGIEINESYCRMAVERLRQQAFDFTSTGAEA